jgi:8-oxo-dGTP pyrophosphatase MutT (NUDIX family)
MKTQTSPNFSRKPSTQILRELSVEEAMDLRPSNGISVAVILNVAFDRDINGNVLKVPEMLNITEWQDRGNYEVTKLPAGSMNHEDIDVIAAAVRELFSETGYVAKEWFITKAVETTSTIQSERHYKVFLAGKNATKVGEPTELCIRKVTRSPIYEIQKYMTYDQRIGLRASIAKMRQFSAEFWYALDGHVPVDWFPKN